MGYRIDYTLGDGVLQAVVSGRSSFARDIARDIGERARQNAARQVLIDLRGLQARCGRLRALLAAERPPKRIAVVDVRVNDPYYVFVELAARARGCALRRFDDHAAARSWLLERRG